MYFDHMNCGVCCNIIIMNNSELQLVQYSHMMIATRNVKWNGTYLKVKKKQLSNNMSRICVSILGYTHNAQGEIIPRCRCFTYIFQVKD